MRASRREFVSFFVLAAATGWGEGSPRASGVVQVLPGRCAFCGKAPPDVRALVVSTKNTRAGICDECVVLGLDLWDRDPGIGPRRRSDLAIAIDDLQATIDRMFEERLARLSDEDAARERARRGRELARLMAEREKELAAMRRPMVIAMCAFCGQSSGDGRRVLRGGDAQAQFVCEHCVVLAARAMRDTIAR